MTKSDPNLCSLSIAADRTRALLGCYRKGDAEDPEVYTTAVAAVLARYPEDVVKRVTDPRGGLPGTSQWLPTVHEVRAACETEMAPMRAAERRKEERAHTRFICGKDADVSLERRKELVAEIQARFSHFKDNANRRIFRAPEQLAAEYETKPLTVSFALRELLAKPSPP